MFLSDGALPHLLPPKDYWCPHRFEKESAFLRGFWHLVGSKAQLASSGDFLTCQLLGHPVQIRNFQGQLRALSNVCAHRHCLISSQPRGHSSSMRCQYHGWEYAASGKPCKIPSPKSFVPFPKKTIGLPVYAVESVGDLVFVRLEREGISLENQLGSLYSLCRDRFSRPWAGFLEKHLDYPSNWKVAVENSLEAYHVPCVHPLSFGADPGESRSLHILEPGYTGFRTNLPFAHRRIDELFQRCENWVARRLESTASGEYWHYHVFPNLLFAITDTSSFFQSVLPQGPGSSKAIVVQFGLSGSTAGQRALGSVWGRLKASLTRQIVEEDQALFSAVQSGLEASSQQGLLGRCEERIHAFQSYLQRACPP